MHKKDSTIIKLSVFIIVTFLSLQSFGQYQRVVNTGKSWNYFGEDLNTSMDSCYVFGDTIIDQKKYFEVYALDYWGNDPESICFLHEDTISGKIYRIPSLYQINDEVLVYDISLNVGDTFNIEMQDYIIDSVVYTDGRKHIFFNEPWYWYSEVTFIEGIGSVANMLGGGQSEYFKSALLCSYQDSLNIYTHDSIPWLTYYENSLCWVDITVGINDTQSKSEIGSYPNPFTTSTTIEYELTEPSHVQITIYNAIGEVVYLAVDDIKQQGKHSLTWSPERLPVGMYYAVLRSEEGVSVAKMVKQHL